MNIKLFYKDIDNRHTKYYICNMKAIEWNDEKNLSLQRERGVCFENVVVCLINNKVFDTIKHPNKEKYPNQRIF